MQNQRTGSIQLTQNFSQWYHQNIFYWELFWVIIRWLLLIGMLLSFAFIGGWLFEAPPSPKPPSKPKSLLGLGPNSMTVAFSEDSNILITASSDSTLRFWNLQTTGQTPDSILIQGQESGLVAAAASRSGKWLAVSGNNHEIWLFDQIAQRGSGEPIILKGHQNKVTQLAFSPDENWLASAGEDHQIRLWYLVSSPTQSTPSYSILLPLHTEPITALAFSPNNRWLASGSQGGSIRLWDLNRVSNPEEMMNTSIQLNGHSEKITDLAFSPKGRWLASASTDNSVRLWDVFLPDPVWITQTVKVLTGYRGDVVDLEFSPFGQWLVTAGEDKTVRLWNLNTWDIAAQKPVILELRSSVTSVTMTPDQHWLITTSNDSNVRIWNMIVADIADQDPFVLRDHRGKAISSMASPNGRWVATVDDRNGIKVWDLTTIRPPAFSLFNQNSLRHILIPLAVFIAIMISAGAYVQDIYYLPSLRYGIQYVIASMFGIGYPQLTIDGGRAILRKGEINLLRAIGGPGFVLIQPGNAAFFRYLRRPTGARINRYVFLGPFESLGAIVSLEDQEGYIESWQCTTQDGIPIELRDIRFRFRVRYIEKMNRTMENPYPIDPKALMQRGGNITVNERGPIPWEDSIRMAVTTSITDYIQKNTIDYLTAPRRSDQHPRFEFQRYILDNAKVYSRGAELLWIEVGHFHILDERVEETRIDAWAVEQKGLIEQRMARVEADQKILQELGRAEGQAEIIRSIAQALNEVNMSGSPKENIHRVFLARVAQIIETWALPDSKNLSEQHRKDDIGEHGRQ